MNGIKICDMGLSKFRDAKQATVTTMKPHPTDTYPYMAPEMFGANRRGTGVDIYSYGVHYKEFIKMKSNSSAKCSVT